MVGEAAIDQSPTMRLCLNGTGFTRSKYNVLHETGHALGLYHEHQHPDAVDIYDKAKVIEDLKELHRMSCNVAENYYTSNFEKSEKRDEDEYDYDPDSVMRYE